MLAANKKSIRNFVVAIACSLTIAIPAAVNAQSSPLTVQPSTGRVGIGNTNPQQPLDVTGNANVTGNVTASGFIGDGSQLTNLPGGSAALNKVTANTTVSGSAEGTLYSFSLSGGTLGTNNMVRLTIQISDLDIQDGNTLVLRLKYGGTTLGSVSLPNSSGSSVDNAKGLVVVVLAADGATNTQLGSLAFHGSSATLGNARLGQGTSAIDSTATQTLTVTADFASSGDSVTLGYAVLEKIS